MWRFVRWFGVRSKGAGERAVLRETLGPRETRVGMRGSAGDAGRGARAHAGAASRGWRVPMVWRKKSAGGGKKSTVPEDGGFGVRSKRWREGVARSRDAWITRMLGEAVMRDAGGCTHGGGTAVGSARSRRARGTRGESRQLDWPISSGDLMSASLCSIVACGTRVGRGEVRPGVRWAETLRFPVALVHRV